MPRVISSSHKFRPCFIFSSRRPIFLPSFPPLTLSSSFHFISFHSILSQLILYHARARIRPCHDVRMSEVSDVSSFPCLFFLLLFPPGAFIWRFPSETGRETGNRQGRKEKTRRGTLGFIPVVNNIFIVASSKEEKRGAQKCNSGGCLPFLCMPTESL